MVFNGILKQCTKGYMVNIGLQHMRKYSTELSSIREWLRGFSGETGGSVDLQKDNETGIAVVTINNPKSKNALDGRMMSDLAYITDELQSWKAGKGIILHGKGDSFCSGGNLAFVSDLNASESGSKMSFFMQSTLLQFSRLPLVSLALINGRAIGGGAELAVCCDFRLVTPDSALGFVHNRMGVSPGFGGGCKLVQLIGRTDALELLLTGNILSYEEILGFGLANGVVPTDKALEEAKAWLGKRTQTSREVLAAAKGVVLNAINNRPEDVLEGERQIFKSVWMGPAHKEALSKKVKHRR